ncbi:MAG: chromosomal replication initiator protein DnaA [Deltaproteobacteria bacterium]|nr:chromosomal replication initiator protein DnaA [Candidatus Anaeroferrophillacea bacterium]
MNEQIWETVLGTLRGQISEQNFHTWFEPIRFRGVEGSTAILEVPNKFFRDWLTDNYPSAIERAFRQVTEQDLQVSYTVARKRPAYARNLNAADAVMTVSLDHSIAASTTHLLNPHYSFANFVVGNSNEFSHAASLAVAKQPGGSYNPLFIYSSAGLGKTHLLHAIGNHIVRQFPSMNVFYVTSEDFTNDLISALKEDKMQQFRSRYRQMDVLLIDDIQFIAGKERTQEEFFHTFNALYKTHKQIVLTSDKVPAGIPKLEDRLRTRFEWGLIADIQPPDSETLVAILITKAAQEHINLSTEVAFFLAENVSTNIRTLEGALVRIAAISSFKNEDQITIDFVKRVLKDIIKLDDRIISIDDIIGEAAAYFRLKSTDIRSRRKTRNIVLPRQIAMYLARQLTSCSYPDIAEQFGGKDHSTVIYAERKVRNLMQTNDVVRDALERISVKLKQC